MPLAAGRHVRRRVALYLTPPGLTRPDRPGDRLGPTSGGSIGSQGWWDTSYRLTFCSAVPCLTPLTAGRHVAQASSPVLDLTDLLRTPQTWRPSGTYFRRTHRISGYGRPGTSPHLLLAVHCHTPHSAERHVAQASSSVPDLTWSHRS